MKLLLTALCLACSLCALSQNSILRSSNLALKVDTVTALEDMTAATTLTITSPDIASPLTSFANGFTFRFGLDTFSQFSISRYGFIKFGNITSFTATSQDSTIAALFSFGSFPNIKYKYMGTAPYRVFVVEWMGTFTPTSQTIRVQLFLHETNGRIQIVHSGSNAYGSGNAYRIFLRHNFYGLYHMTSVDVQAGGLQHFAVYKAFSLPSGYPSAEVNNTQAIFPLSRFTFQPDTTQSPTPLLNFQNVMPGCMDVVPDYDSTAAFACVLERQYGTPAFKRLKLVPSGQHYDDDDLYAEATYQYRGWTTNGFRTSDTTVQLKQMPTGLIGGVKMIPGDYPNITALINDAPCKQFASNLVIELQSNYDYALEPNTVVFGPRLRSPALQHVVIRPAAGANLILRGPGNRPMFIIDSMTHIEFDGREGGTGSTPALRFRQSSVSNSSFVFTNAADSGAVRYCIFDTVNKNAVGAIYITNRDYPSLNILDGCNGISIDNNLFGPTSGVSYTYIRAEGGPSRGNGLRIEKNEFFSFERESMILKNMQAPLVKENRFYQPNHINYFGPSVITIENGGLNTMIEGNRFGGSSATWGVGKWSTGGDFNFISTLNGATIKSNEFGNIQTSSALILIRSNDGPMIVSKNKFGTADSTRSIVSVNNNLFGTFMVGTGKKVIDSNFFSGFRAAGQLVLAGAGTITQDPVNEIRDNDFGGADNFDQNTSDGLVTMIDAFPGSFEIRQNKFRGGASRMAEAVGISAGFRVVTSMFGNYVIEDNMIHHLRGNMTVYGIYLNAHSNGFNRVANNTVYSLRGIGPSVPGSHAAHIPMNCGIYAENYGGPPEAPDSAVLEVQNNFIHSMDYFTTMDSPLDYYIQGMNVNASYRAFVNNNVIRIGLDPFGQAVDTIDARMRGLEVKADRADISHNTIFLGGTGGEGIYLHADNDGAKTSFVTNNIIAIDKEKTRSIDYPNAYMSAYNQGYPWNSVAANNNLWYSPNDPDINATLASWQAACQCDLNSVIGDPNLVNPKGDSVSLDLHLGVLSAADSMGTAPLEPVLLDKDSLVRNQYSPHDAGAYAATPCASGAPVAIVLSPGVEMIKKCAGSGVTLSANITGSYTGLKWQRNMTDISGATGTSVVAVLPGSYRLVAQYVCGMSASLPIQVMDTVAANINPVITASPGFQVCPNTNVTLNATVNNCPTCVYTWSNGVTGQSITVDPANGPYSVTINSGCGSATFTPTVTVLPNPTITVNASPSATVCPGGMVNLNAAGADSYSWSPATGLSTTTGPVTNASPMVTTTYTVTGTSNGCSSTQHITVNVFTPGTNVTPMVSSICNGSSVTLTATGGSNYVWTPATGLNTVNGPVVIASPTSTTKYTVTSTGSPCPDTATATVNVTACVPTAIEPIDGLEHLSVSPNPTTGPIYVQIKLSSLKKVHFTLRDQTGRMVYSSAAVNLVGSHTRVIPVGQLAGGLYYLQVRIGEKVAERKVVLVR